MVLRRDDLQTTTTATTLSTSRIGRRRCHVLDSANLDALRESSAQRALTAGPGDFVLLPPFARILMCNAVIPSSLHRAATSCAASIAAYGEDSSRSAFTFIPGAPAQGFLAGQIRDVLRGNNGDTRVDVSLSRHRVDVIRDDTFARTRFASSTRSRRVAPSRRAPIAPSRPLRAFPRDRARARVDRALALALARTHHERVVKRRKDMRDAEDELAFARVGADVRSLR